MRTALSVILCSHNPRRDYLDEVLAALRSQSVGLDNWQLLLIDNLSNQNLGSSIDLSWHPDSLHIREEQLGLTHARLRGIGESRGDLLIFVDDDNVLDYDYIERALEVFHGWKSIGAWSGQCRPRFEIPPPAWTRRHWGSLAIRKFDNDHWSNLPRCSATMPFGAGLCVRRQVALHYFELHQSGKRKILLDRVGTSLVSGGDDDLAECACDIGLGMGLFAKLKLVHLIPAERLQEDYLVRLTEGIAYSGLILTSFRSPVSIMHTTKLKTRLADILRMLLMTRRERRFFNAHKTGQLRAMRRLNQEAAALTKK
jgi:Glycosyl transferase family 2